MPNQTTNYNLTKPLETERYDVQVFNNNADIIDAQMKSNADGIANVNSRLDNLNNWTTVEFTLADFMYNENGGITYLRTEAPSGYEIAEIKGYFVLNKVETDSSETVVVMDTLAPRYLSDLSGRLFRISQSANTIKGAAATVTANINLDLLYSQSVMFYSVQSNNINWSSGVSLNGTGFKSQSLIDLSRFETTSFTLKTNVPHANISEFYGKLQYRVVPS